MKKYYISYFLLIFVLLINNTYASNHYFHLRYTSRADATPLTSVVDKPSARTGLFTMDISHDLLKEYFDYRDGFLYWKKLNYNARNPNLLGSKAGYIRKPKCGYNSRIIIFRTYHMAASRAIFMWHNGWLPKMIDHKDRNQLNDKIENLRPATPQQNAQNRKPRKGASSKYQGVAFNKKMNYWHAHISINKKGVHLGCFKNEKDAALAYNEAAKLHYKEFANPNIIEP